MYVCMSIHQPSSLSLAYQITKPHRTPIPPAGGASTTSNINAPFNSSLARSLHALTNTRTYPSLGVTEFWPGAL